MASASKKTDRFSAGDWVTFRYGARNRTAQIAEARGALGVNGRRLYGIRRFQDSGEPDLFELPEDELQASVPGRSAVVEYLRNGGLVAILKSNLGGGSNQPKVWLTCTAHGDIVHTFEPSRGVAGGDTIPFNALHGDKVFAPKRDEVKNFLGSFGLTSSEVAEVLSAVGTAP